MILVEIDQMLNLFSQLMENLKDPRKKVKSARSNRIGGVKVSMFASSAVYRGFEQRSGQTTGYAIGI
jgi:hypothetical protein